MRKSIKHQLCWFFLSLTYSLVMKLPLFSWTKLEAVESILKIHWSQWYCNVNYLYFANAMKLRLFEKTSEPINLKYAKALKESDIILPDGIALQLFSKNVFKKSLHNLNWTDFLPYFLQYLQSHQILFRLSIYWSKSQYTQQVTEYFEWIDAEVIYAQDGYSDYDRFKLPPFKQWVIDILLVGRWTPLQEIWSYENIIKVKERWLLVMNQWWTFDFLIWQEKRAPNWVVKARILETFRRIWSNPKKNLHKFIAMFWIFRRIFTQKDTDASICTKNL